MKIGDLVRIKCSTPRIGVIMSELRHGVNSSFCEVLIAGVIVTHWLGEMEMIRESR